SPRLSPWATIFRPCRGYAALPPGGPGTPAVCGGDQPLRLWPTPARTIRCGPFPPFPPCPHSQGPTRVIGTVTWKMSDIAAKLLRRGRDCTRLDIHWLGTDTMATPEQWLGKLAHLKVDKARGDPAPHKPLLL